jgi:hypothetical protein
MIQPKPVVEKIVHRVDPHDLDQPEKTFAVRAGKLHQDSRPGGVIGRVTTAQ